MALFVVQHRHRPEACSARAGWGPRLLSHLSAGAAYHGVAIQAEAVIDETHTLLLIVEAGDRAHVDRFMAAFAAWGSVTAQQASTAEEVIGRGGCRAAAAP